MSANKPQPQQGGQKPNQEDEFNKGGQNRDQEGQQKDRNTPDNINKGGQGTQGGGR